MRKGGRGQGTGSSDLVRGGGGGGEGVVNQVRGCVYTYMPRFLPDREERERRFVVGSSWVLSVVQFLMLRVPWLWLAMVAVLALAATQVYAVCRFSRVHT